jgi:hypothetical protein
MTDNMETRGFFVKCKSMHKNKKPPTSWLGD